MNEETAQELIAVLREISGHLKEIRGYQYMDASRRTELEQKRFRAKREREWAEQGQERDRILKDRGAGE